MLLLLVQYLQYCLWINRGLCWAMLSGFLLCSLSQMLQLNSVLNFFPQKLVEFFFQTFSFKLNNNSIVKKKISHPFLKYNYCGSIQLKSVLIIFIAEPERQKRKIKNVVLKILCFK